ncbi:MAG: A/G-specific adenine glycosylase [Deltaproteobacteria bacterium]|nr:A/G-specific adenine glycosylase [Deltaproteobacteria bacterium]
MEDATALAGLFQKRLLAWYDREARRLPWRETRDPYRIWVSEIMLQQTQVKTVEAYYTRFLASFPTVEALAQAAPDEVMKAWEGLGYYSRARHLHRAAREVVVRFQGRLPATAEALLSLPGIGRYTAGAILSIAFGKRAAVLDGNVIRVLSRFFRVTDDVRLPATQEGLWQLAEGLLPRGRLRDYNQALMELGALVCRVRNPLCPACPLSERCEASRLSLQGELPVKSPRKPVPHYQVTAAVIRRGDQLLITRRPPKGLLGGLWEFPGGKREPGETLEDCLKREIREELGIAISVGPHLISVEHAYTHFRITLHAFECRSRGGRIRLLGIDDYRWILPRELDAFALPAADHKIVALLQARDGAKAAG